MKIFYILFVLLFLKSIFCENKIENEKEQIIKIAKVLEKLTKKYIKYELILNDIKLIIENLQIFSFYYNITKKGNSNQCLENITFILLYDIDLYKNYSYFEKISISQKKHCYTYLYYKSICFKFKPDNTMTYYLSSQNLINITYNIWFDKFKVFQNILIENDIKIKDFFQNTLSNSLDRIFESYPISIYETFYSNLLLYISGKCFEINLTQLNITHIKIFAILYDNIKKNKTLNEYILNNVRIFFRFKRENIFSDWKRMEIAFIKFQKYQIFFGIINKEKEFELGIKQIFLISKEILLKI